MKQPACQCEKPILCERSERKGAVESFCDRCKRPLSLRPATRRAA
jgi:hypothetical protein